MQTIIIIDEWAFQWKIILMAFKKCGILVKEKTFRIENVAVAMENRNNVGIFELELEHKTLKKKI